MTFVDEDRRENPGEPQTPVLPVETTAPKPKTASRDCPLCSERQVEALYTQRFRLPGGSPLPEIYDVVACSRCGLVYADTPVPQKEYDRYYAEFSKYEDPAVATGGGGSDLDLRRLEGTADALAARVDKDARVLDVGCAGGGLLSSLRRRGFRRLHGTDAAAACVQQVASMGINATRAPLSDLSSLDSAGPYDLIVLSHVLEHVVNLRPVISAVVTLAAPGGFVYAETPDASRYAEYSYVPFYFFDAEHINHFDTERLALLGASAGLLSEEAGVRTLQIAPDKTYPACWIFWKRKASVQPVAHPRGSRSLRDRIAAYVQRCGSGGQFPQLKALAASGKPVVVWGAGSFALRLFGEDALAGCHIVAIVDRDRNKQGHPFAGFTVEAPEEALRRNPGAVVLVAAAVCEAAIAAEARDLLRGGEIVTLTPDPQRTQATDELGQKP